MNTNISKCYHKRSFLVIFCLSQYFVYPYSFSYSCYFNFFSDDINILEYCSRQVTSSLCIAPQTWNKIRFIRIYWIEMNYSFVLMYFPFIIFYACSQYLLNRDISKVCCEKWFKNNDTSFSVDFATTNIILTTECITVETQQLSIMDNDESQFLNFNVGILGHVDRLVLKHS